MSCNQDVHIVSKELFSGSYISENIYGRSIKQTARVHILCKNVQIISNFSMFDCFSLHKLLTNV